MGRGVFAPRFSFRTSFYIYNNFQSMLFRYLVLPLIICAIYYALCLLVGQSVHTVLFKSEMLRRFPSVLSPATARAGVRSYSQSPSAPFTYRLGASSSSKSKSLKNPSHGENFFSYPLIPDSPSYFTSTKRYSGEDAFFMSHVARSNRHVVFGIADGVGGWQDQGIDPSHFSQGLCKYMAEAVSRPENEEDLRPKNVLQKGYDQVMKDDKIVAGGSTACVAAIEPRGAMEVAKWVHVWFEYENGTDTRHTVWVIRDS